MYMDIETISKATGLTKDELEKLSALEKEVVKERYFNDYTQKKVADNLGMSQVQVSRQEQKVLEKLRKKLV